MFTSWNVGIDRGQVQVDVSVDLGSEGSEWRPATKKGAMAGRQLYDRAQVIDCACMLRVAHGPGISPIWQVEI